MAKSAQPAKGGLPLPISRRSLLQATAIVSGGGLLSVRGGPIFASEVFDLGYQQVRWGELSASAVLMLVPVLAFVFIFQKQLVRGLTMGATK